MGGEAGEGGQASASAQFGGPPPSRGEGSFGPQGGYDWEQGEKKDCSQFSLSHDLDMLSVL